MSRILIQCPSCKTRFRIDDLEDMDGEKVVCKKCHAPFRIRLAKSKRSSSGGDEIYEVGADAIIEEDSTLDDEFDLAVDDLAPAPESAVLASLGPSPLLRKKTKKKAAPDD